MDLLEKVEKIIKAKRFDELKTLNFSELPKLGRTAAVPTPPAYLFQGQGITFMSELLLPKKDVRLQPFVS